MSAYTPGPWHTDFLYYSDIPQNARIVIHAASKSDAHSATKVAEASFAHEGSDYHVSNRGEAEANARLIAAAPDLMEALQLAIRQNSHDMLMTGEELRQCEAAIAKATGNQDSGKSG